MSTWPVTETQLQTVTSNVRNSYSTTFVSTYLNSYGYEYQMFGCMSYTCYDSTAASSCTGSCTDTAWVCTDPNFPRCASVYMSTWYTPSTMTSGVYTRVATSFFCDTAAYGLAYDAYGNWPSVLSTYTTTTNYTSTSTIPTWTPTVVPYSMSQLSRPASASTVPGPTSTSGALSNCRQMSWFRHAAVALCVYYFMHYLW